MNKIGIDLGGTKIEMIVLNNQGKELIRQRVATPQGKYKEILQAISGLVDQAEKAIGGFACVGIGTPGAISPATGLMKNSNTICLNGRSLLQDLEKYLGKKVRIENDANCFALSEAVDGAAIDADSVFGVIIGTGTGAGIVINRQILKGANAISGEWGHNPLPWPQPNELPGLDCYCGKQGCIETWLSGVGLSRNFKHVYGVDLTAEVMVIRAAKGDENCEQALRNYEDRLARGLAHIINILDPQVIVLGGGLSNILRLYQNVPDLWGQYVFSDSVVTKLVKPVFGDSSGVRGAAWLC